MIIFYCLLYLPFVSQIQAQPYHEVLVSNAPDSTSESRYGRAVAIEGDYTFVGASLESKDEHGDDSIHQAGAVYVLQRDLWGNWQQQQKLVPNERQILGLFGQSVSLDGDYALVGSNAVFPAGDSLSYGSGIVFKRNLNGIWTERAKLISAGVQVYDDFAESVAISGRHAIISAHLDNNPDIPGHFTHADGAAFIFEREVSSETWHEVAKLWIPDTVDENYFGRSVDIEGDYAIIGAPNEDEDSQGLNTIHDAGAAYVFKRDSTGQWNLMQKLTAPQRRSPANFGISVAIEDAQLFVGAHRHLAYDSTGTTVESRGLVYVFEQDSTGDWVFIQRIKKPDQGAVGASGGFGHTISIKNGGMIVGARFDFSSETSAYILKKESSGQWVHLEKKWQTTESNPHHIFAENLAIDGPSAVAGLWTDRAVHYEVCRPYTRILKVASCDPFDFLGTTVYNTGTYNNTVYPSVAYCDSAITATLNFERIEADTAVIQSGDSLTATAEASTFQWLDCLNGLTPISGATNATFVPADSMSSRDYGYYAVRVTTERDSCTARSDCFRVDFTTSVSEALLQKLSLYPNPNTGRFTLDLRQIAQPAEVEMYDLTGRLISKQGNLSGKVVLDITGKGYGPGLYVVQVIVGSQRATMKMLWE